VKYALGHGRACVRLKIGGNEMAVHGEARAANPGH
jgi:hypothetical protein